MTKAGPEIANFAPQKKDLVRFNVIAFTHAGIGLKGLSSFHIEDTHVAEKMRTLKADLHLSEIMYLSTCNRVEFIFVKDQPVDETFVAEFIRTFNPEWTIEESIELAKKSRFWNGINAVNHLIEVASSLDSMVLGEREIITQVRNAYDYSKANGLSADTIRVVIRQTIETAKKVYTQTSISEKSVSVVSLAYQQLALTNPSLDARILIIGAGVTNQNMSRFLLKHGFNNFTVYNRTLANAEKLASAIGGKAYPLSELENHKEGFDIIITCTGSNEAVLTAPIYQQIVQDKTEKLIVDLAIPEDTDAEIIQSHPVRYISVDSLKSIADRNLLERKKELLKVRQIIFDALEEFKEIFEMRQMEIKMRSIPKKS